MTDTTQIAANDIIMIVTQKPEIALLEPERFNAFLVALRGEIDGLTDVDMAKAKDRDRVRSVAAGIARHKAAINKARLSLTAGWREQTKDVNARGGDIDDKLSTLGDKVREPLTAWEDAEKRRVETCRSVIDAIRDAARYDPATLSGYLRDRREMISAHVLDAATFLEMLDEALEVQSFAITALDVAIEAAEKREAEEIELAALRAEKAERDAADAERDRLASEAALAAKRADHARIAEEARKVEQEAREKRLAEEAAAKATRDAEIAAERAQRERDAAHERELARERQIRIDNERRIEAERIAAEKRETNKRHRAKLAKESATAIAAIDRGGPNGAISYETALAIVEAIAAGSIPNIEMRF